MPSPIALEAMPKNGQQQPLYKFGRAKNRAKGDSKWNHHEFICFDGEGINDSEGIQHYCYLAAYNGKKYYRTKSKTGLSTKRCFEFLCKISTNNQQFGICVIYGGSYDANMMLKDVDVPTLTELQKGNFVQWKEYTIQFVPRKYLYVKNNKTDQHCKLWDVIGFFQSKFTTAIATWLDVEDKIITEGKANRGQFTLEGFDEMALYCDQELLQFEKLMQALWTALNNAGFKLSRWDGAGAIAGFLFKDHGMAMYKGTQEEQDKHYDKARSAYAGGRFELCSPGDYRQTVYNYDINSAYPYALSLLPPFTDLVEIDPNSTISDYDLCYIKFDGTKEFDLVNPILPFFHRYTGIAQITYPPITHGWKWGVEVNNARALGFPVEVTEVWHWPDNGERPWQWVQELYNHRKVLKQEGNSAEKAIKLGLNSLYGKTAQQKGWHEGESIPRTHQLYWAGWVTAKCRSMIFAAMMQHPRSVIAVETDGIYCTKPLELPLGEGLGEWECTVYDNMTYIQSGMYFADKADKSIVKYRGIEAGTLTREMILKAYEGYEPGIGLNDNIKELTVKAYQTRFRTLGTSLIGNRMSEWRRWIREEKEISLVQRTGKRLHSPLCQQAFGKCKWGVGYSHETVPAGCQPGNPESAPYPVIWCKLTDEEMARRLEYDAAMSDYDNVDDLITA